MEMMRAVLDTNFWLATHVVVVTLGYASTFVAGFLASDLHSARDVHQDPGRTDCQSSGADGLRHCLLRDPVQLLWGRCWAAFGLINLGGAFGAGIQRKMAR